MVSAAVGLLIVWRSVWVAAGFLQCGGAIRMFCFSCGSLGLLEMVKSLLYKLGVALVFISIAGCRGVYSHVCFSCCHMPVFGNGSCAHVAGGVRFIGLYIPLLLEISLLYIKPCPPSVWNIGGFSS